MQLKWPLKHIFITQGFGVNPKIYAQFGMKGHDGLDLRTRWYDSPLARMEVKAAADGVVFDVQWAKTGYGYHVRIRHADGSITIYGHLSVIKVSKNQIVKCGQVIGISGNTGFSSGSHLHFEYRPQGWEKMTGNGYAGAINPLPLLPKL